MATRENERRSAGSGWKSLAALVLVALACGSCSEDQVVEPEAGVVWTRLTPTSFDDCLYPDVRGDSLVFIALGPNGFGSAPRLALSLADGTGAQVLGYPGPSPWVEFRPRWVRSQTVVYQANRNGTFDIWYKDLDTGADYRLTKDATNESAPAPRPGTAGLVYVEYDNNVNTEGSADLRGRLVLIPDTTDVPLQHIYLTSDMLRCGEPDWDPSGTRLCFSMEDSLDLTRHLFTLDLSTANPQPVQITQGPSHDYAPRWSPDGAHIVFTSDRSARYGVWVVSPLGESKGITLVSFEDPGASVYTPAWTPDGMSILVSSDGRGGAGHIRSLWLITNLPVFPF